MTDLTNLDGWNYRVLRKTFKIGEEIEHRYAIHEVYYNTDGEPVTCTVDSVEPSGETEEELRRDIKNYLKALDKPVLDFDKDFGDE